MTYQTPELLLVGAAHNLVLGDLGKFADRNEDGPLANTYAPGNIDSDGW